MTALGRVIYGRCGLEVSSITMRASQPSLTWLHLSDLHFLAPDRRYYAEQSRLLNSLQEDILQVISKGHKPDFIFITGDVAFSGGEQEYDEANAWIKRLLSATGLNESDVFTVPGNHDVQRAKATDKPVSELTHRALRHDPKPLDGILDHVADVSYVLWPKFEEYTSFASSYGPPHFHGQLYWKSQVASRLGPVNLAGLNTAILSFDDKERAGDMRLGARQLEAAVAGDSEDLRVVLIHHPLEWLGDGDVLAETLNAHPHLLLSGHVHDSSIRITSRRNGPPLLELMAGAGQSGDDTHWSMGRLSAAGLELWPRMWLTKPRRFHPDVNYHRLEEDCVRKSVEELPEPLQLWLTKRHPRDWSVRKTLRGVSRRQRLPAPKLERQGSVKVGDPTILCTAFAGHENKLVAAGEDNLISCFDLSQPEHPRVATLKGHRGTVASLAISQDGRRAVSGGRDNQVIVWDLEERALVRTLHIGNWIYGLASTEDGTQFISGDNFNHVTVWNFDSDHPITTLTGHTDWIRDVQVSRSKRFIVSASSDGTLRLWELSTGRCLKIFKGHEGKVRSVVFSPDDQLIISGGDHGYVIVWEAETGRMVNRLQLHSHTVNSIVVLGDGPFCLSAGRDMHLCLFRFDGTQYLERFTLPHELNRMALSPSQRRVAVACDDGRVYLYGIA